MSRLLLWYLYQDTTSIIDYEQSMQYMKYFTSQIPYRSGQYTSNPISTGNSHQNLHFKNVYLFQYTGFITNATHLHSLMTFITVKLVFFFFTMSQHLRSVITAFQQLYRTVLYCTFSSVGNPNRIQLK